MRFRILIWLAMLPISLYAVSDFDRDQIQQRISPVGQVRVQEPPLPAGGQVPAPEVKQEEPKVAGQDTYEKYCMVCHGTGVAGAPKFRVEEDWKARLAKQDIASLTATAITGLNAMPPKGTCADCSDEEIKAAVQYMVPQS